MAKDFTGFQIEHSGQTFTALGTGPHGHPIWPIDEYLARTKHTQDEIEIIEAHYPNGKEEAEWDGTIGFLPRYF